MKTIIHDLDNIEIDNNIILNNYNIKNCIGCFNCWTNTPMKCIHKDSYKEVCKNILNSDTLIIISRNFYGTYSSKVKKILERNIGFVLPYFVIRNKEIHHKARIKQKLDFITIFYGRINSKEKLLLEKLVNRNALNFNLKKPTILYFKNENDVRRYLNESIY